MNDTNYWSALVPELIVSDVVTSTAFYSETLGFHTKFSRPEDGLVYLELGQAQIMLEQMADGVWLTGDMEHPFGRGINIQIEVEDVNSIYERALAANCNIFRPLRISWYREDDQENG